MKLIEAIRLGQHPVAPGSEPFPVLLACGFTPLHLQTFLAAHLRMRLPGRPVEISTGLYDDLPGTLESVPDRAEAVVVTLEWPDLDPRLGYRNVGDWSLTALDDIVSTASERLGRILGALRAQRGRAPVAVSLPTLPFPPCSFHSPGEAAPWELRLRAELAAFAASVAELPHTVVLNQDELGRVSPPGARADLRTELANGFPYTVAHAESLASLCAAAVAPAPTKKGIITDLDNTLWRGLVGEDGIKAVSWSLEDHAQSNAIYQQFLNSLVEAGILVGIASRNDPAVAQRALERSDLVLKAERVFPTEVHWSAKSESVSRILRAWNVGPESVVFVDDSPMELAEVQAVHPEIDCVLFPHDDPAALPDFLRGLRRRFGKRSVREEDSLRSASLRQNSAFVAEADSPNHAEAFLRGAAPRITIRFGTEPLDERALELINKTNQFNLNGRRVGESAWGTYLADPSVELMMVEYEDRFGRLGKIAVVAGRSENGHFRVDHWVMSCRAFARRIEHGTLAAIFQRFGCTSVCLDFHETNRNGPMKTFLSSVAGPVSPGPVWIAREAFDAGRPPLYHHVEIL